MSLTRSPLYAYANSVGYDNIGPVNIVCTICKDCFYSKYSRFRFVAAVLKLQSLRLPWWFIDANTSAIQVPGYENAGPRGENEIDFEVQITMRTTAWPNVLIGNVARVPGSMLQQQTTTQAADFATVFRYYENVRWATR